MLPEDEATTAQHNGAEEDLEVLTSILATLQNLDPRSRVRILDTITTYFGRERAGPHRIATQGPQLVSGGLTTDAFSEDRSMSPKQFVAEKQPKTDVERVACLAYYLTHYRNTPHFKTLDISKLNTEAAQIKFSNPTVAVDNATRANYLVPATKGNKQLGVLGEQFVQALPDREKAKNVMAQARPRRKSKKQQRDFEPRNESEPDNSEES
jgi:hypothetical protein